MSIFRHRKKEEKNPKVEVEPVANLEKLCGDSCLYQCLSHMAYLPLSPAAFQIPGNADPSPSDALKYAENQEKECVKKGDIIGKTSVRLNYKMAIGLSLWKGTEDDVKLAYEGLQRIDPDLKPYDSLGINFEKAQEAVKKFYEQRRGEIKEEQEQRERERSGRV